MSDLVKCFSNSVLGVNLTTILIDMEPWFIAKEVATLLGYTDTAKAVRTHVDDLDSKTLKYNECKELFGLNIIDVETVENEMILDRPKWTLQIIQQKSMLME